ncbi:MAG: TetR/AcrR family transcriptional regulator [Eubacterium sp.]
MDKKENQRIALTKRLLKESLQKLMQNKNIQNITVSELCEKAGINRSTFYNHYGCPGDVLKEMELEVIYDLEQLLFNNNDELNSSMNKELSICAIICLSIVNWQNYCFVTVILILNFPHYCLMLPTLQKYMNRPYQM